MAFILTGNLAFSRDLDVDIQVTREQVEVTTDLSIAAAIVTDAPFEHDSGRVRFYTSINQVEVDFATTTEAWRMANAFFSQSPRALRMAIGRIFTAPVAGFAIGDTVGALSAFQAVSDGAFTISIDGDEQEVTAIDTSAVTTFDDVATAVQARVRSVGSGGFASATAVIEDNRLTIRSGTTGATSRVSIASSPTSGTDFSTATYLNFATARDVEGYTPGDLVSELANVDLAARVNNRFIYGWALQRSYRDTQDAIDASAWVNARRGLLALVSNSALALDSGNTTDTGAVVSARGDVRTTVFWSDQVVQYPDVALLSYILHVNYRQADSTVTAKFKDLAGITPASIDETDLSVLNGKRYNTLTRVGNNARTVREGVNANPIWYIDDLVNLDNYEEILQTEVYNVFLRNPKVPYSDRGVTLIYQAIDNVSRLFVLNGTFAPIPITDLREPSGVRTVPAYNITFTPLNLIPVADRQARRGPPARVDVRLAGAIHTVQINVNASV